MGRFRALGDCSAEESSDGQGELVGGGSSVQSLQEFLYRDM